MEDEAKMARIEAAFREVNEAIARTAERFEADEADFVCECADPSCAHRVTAGLDEYAEVRADGTHFLVVDGHERRSIERVVESNASYAVVEKFGSKVARIVRRLNPRTRPA